MRTISQALARAQPGDAVLVRAGVYRETLRPRLGGREGSPITVAAMPGDEVVVTGADPVPGGWRSERNGTWRLDWRGPDLRIYSADPVFRREMLIADGAVMRPAATLSDLRPGRFWVEGPPESPRAIIARFIGGSVPETVEVGTRSELFWPVGRDGAACGDASMPGYFRLVGLTFRYATNPAQQGAVCVGSAGSVAEDVRVEWTNSLGIDLSGRGHTLRRVRADLNGQLGWGGSCRGCTIDEGAAVGNNWKGFDPFWEAGGIKLTRTSDTALRRFYAAWNDGPGIWLDIDDPDNTVEGSLSVANQVAGIMLEFATTGTLVQHNVVARTRWRDWSGTGILSQAASENALLHNTVVENEGTGVWLRLDPARRAPDGRNVVAHNWVVGNGTVAGHGDREAREMSVEGTSPAHVHSSRFTANAYGRLGRQSPRSTFFVHPFEGSGGAGFRSDDLSRWRELVGGDRGARLVRLGESVEVGALGRVDAGAPRTAPIPFARAGADLSLVRARGDWRNAPMRPAWP